jgi:spore maturation protein CgeB
MALRIDCFMPHVSQYHVLHHFTKKFHEALGRCQVISRLLTLEPGCENSFLQTLLEDRPNCTLTFNPLAPNADGVFFCDMLKIPHLAWLVDPPNYFFDLIHGSLDILKNTHFNILANIDREANKIFQDIGFKNVLFLPLAIEQELSGNVSGKRPYDVVMFASLINYEKNRESWDIRYPNLVDVLQQAAELSLKAEDHSYFKAYADIQKLTEEGKISDKIVAHAAPLCSLDLYLRGLDRVNLVKSVKCTKVHLYDKPEQVDGWGYFLRGRTNYIIHNALPFEETFEVLKSAKIALSCGSWTRDGGTERIFSAMACGALMITTRTPYLEENFIEGKEVLFYDLNRWSEVDGLVEYYLKHEDERLKIALAGQKKVHSHHTWDHRAEELIKLLPTFLK